jgi:hypothetical protein
MLLDCPVEYHSHMPTSEEDHGIDYGLSLYVDLNAVIGASADD